MSLYTDRGAHYFHTPKAGGEIDRGHPTQVGRALEQLGIEHIGPIRPRLEAAPSGRSRRCRTGCPRSSSLPASPTSRRPTLSSATSICLPTTRALRSSRPARARPSQPSRASISTRSCASRRSGRSAMTIASPTERSSCRSPKVRCEPISSRRGSRSTSTRTAPTPSFTGQDASAATTRTAGSGRPDPRAA